MKDCSEISYRDHLRDIERPGFRKQIRDEVRRAVEFGEMPKPGSVLYGALHVSRPILVGIERIEVKPLRKAEARVTRRSDPGDPTGTIYEGGLIDAMQAWADGFERAKDEGGF